MSEWGREKEMGNGPLFSGLMPTKEATATATVAAIAKATAKAKAGGLHFALDGA